MSQTTLASSASKKPLLKRSLDGHSIRRLPILPPHPEFTKPVVNDAYVVLITVLQHAEHFQVTKARIKEESGLSCDRLTAALQYLQAVNIMGKAAWRGNAGLKGWCWRVDLDGKVEHNGTVLHYSQERDEKVQVNARGEMRRRRAGLGGSKNTTGRSKRRRRQCSTKMAPSEAPPLHSYNVQPCIEGKKETPFIPASGENFQSLPGDPQDSHDRQELQEGSESPTTPEVTLPDPQNSQEPQDNEEEIKTTIPVSEDALELIESLGLRLPDPAIAPTFYLQAQTALEADRSPSAWAHHRRGRLAIEKLQQGSRPRKEAALVWFKANLPGWLLEDCLRPGEAITVMAAHKLVRKLHGGSLTLDHFARYWAAVQTERCKRLPLVHVVNLLSSAFAIKNEQDAEHATSAAALVHDKFGRVLYRTERVDASLDLVVPDMHVQWEADTSAWAPDALYELLQGWRSDQLTEGYADRFLWAARIYALAGYMGDRHACVAPLLRDVSAANITKQDVCRWFVESPRGRPTFGRIAPEFLTCGQDTFDVFGLDYQECYARAWRLWVCLAAVRESQLRIPYANMNLNDFCRF